MEFMRELKCGDKVKIRSDLIIGEFYGICYFIPEMQVMLGKIATIQANLSNRYFLEEIEFNWTTEMFEKVYIELEIL